MMTGGLHNVASFLRLEDYEVAEACDGNQAVLLLDQVRVDLVLSDIIMPGLDGLGLLKHIQSVAPDIPVLFMSGLSHYEVEEIIKRGALDFITKPLNFDVFLLKTDGALEPIY